MVWDRRRGFGGLAVWLVNACVLSCSGGAFTSQKTNAAAGDGGASDAATVGNAGDTAGAGTAPPAGGMPTTAGAAGAASNGGHAGAAGSGGTPTIGDSGNGAGGAPDPAPPIATDGLLYWFKADAGVELSGGAISKWADQSGNGFDAVQNLEGLRPKLSTTQLLPLPVLEFDGADDLLALPAFERNFSAGVSV